MATHVKDVMIRNPITIDPEASVGTAVALMRDKCIRHLPVVDDAGRLVGIVSDRDLRDAVFGPAIAEYLPAPARRRVRGLARTAEALRVKDLMTGEVVTIQGDAPLAEAAAVMFERRFGCLPVVEAGDLVGIVTERDVLLMLAQTIRIDPDTYFW